MKSQSIGIVYCLLFVFAFGCFAVVPKVQAQGAQEGSDRGAPPRCPNGQYWDARIGRCTRVVMPDPSPGQPKPVAGTSANHFVSNDVTVTDGIIASLANWLALAFWHL